MSVQTSRHHGASILVVDDEEVVRDVLERLLEPAGFRVETANTADEGLSRLKGEVFQLVLLDLMLPDRSGMEVLRETLRRNPYQTVLMMTAHATVENAVEAMRSGAHHYLTKPFRTPSTSTRSGRRTAISSGH